MKHKLLADDAAERTYTRVLDKGDEAVECITAFAERNGDCGIKYRHRSLPEATPACFDFQTKNCRKTPVEVESEVLSMFGNVAVAV